MLFFNMITLLYKYITIVFLVLKNKNRHSMENYVTLYHNNIFGT